MSVFFRLTSIFILKICNLKKIILALIYLSLSIAQGQSISGHVYDNKTKEPLLGATIYIDGSTIGTTSNNNGYFNLPIKEQINAPLIVSFIGYTTKILPLQNEAVELKIFLDESENQLEEVLIVPDNWSREKKMRYFKNEFFGKSIATKYCKIQNEKDIKLIYNPKTSILTAYADKPIIIINNYLGYEIIYDLADFEMKFAYDINGLNYPDRIYYAGTSFFKEINKKTRKKHRKNREKSYLGSLMHFMRALKNQQLTENNFQIYHKRFPIAPYRFFKFTELENQTKVELLEKKIRVVYDMFDQSTIEFNDGFDHFYIDDFGNHSPTNSLIFSINFGLKRISDMLPLNYNPSKK